MSVRETGVLPATVVEQLAEAYRAYAPHPALLFDGDWLSYAELGEITQKAATLLFDDGAVAGDRIITCLPNSAVLRICEFAILQSGLVRVGLSPRLHNREVAAIAADSTAHTILCEPERVGELRAALREQGLTTHVLAVSDHEGDHTPRTIAQLERTHPLALDMVTPNDAAMLMYSSGTTGQPKGAIVTHGAWVAQTERALAVLPPLGPGDVVLQVAPMTHFGGSIGLDCSVMGAATLTLTRFEPAEVLAALDEYGVTVLPLAPVMLNRLVALMESTGHKPVALRAVPYGGSPTPAPVLRSAVRLFPGALTQFYGLAEALAPLTTLSPAEHEAAAALAADSGTHRLESIGRIAQGIELRIVDGEIVVRGVTVMPGYWNRDALNAEVLDSDGWFSTGDLASIDDGGYLHLLSRASEVIITGGFNVYPGEVERVIAAVDGIREVVVLGMPDTTWGETVVAVAVVDTAQDAAHEATGSPELLEAIRGACAEHLAGFKKPTAIHFARELPRNAAGKVIRNEVRRQLSSAKEDPSNAGT